MQLLINKFPLRETRLTNPKKIIYKFLQNTKNDLSVKLNSHKNKIWNGTDYNIAPLLCLLSLFLL